MQQRDGGEGERCRDGRRALGEMGERLAEQLLVRRGMVLLDRNWRCPAGEIDLVLRERETVVVCEVKTRHRATFGDPIEAITRAKLARLRRLAGLWLSAHPEQGRGAIRLDIVGVLGHPDGTWAVTHLRGVGQ